jgi:hypothetical protein
MVDATDSTPGGGGYLKPKRGWPFAETISDPAPRPDLAAIGEPGSVSCGG